MNYRNKRILDEAQHHACQSCGSDDDTVVAAHSNQQRHGKGMGIKAHDCFVAYLCAACHYWLDQSSGPSKALRADMWGVAHTKSIPLFSRLLDARGLSLLKEAA